MKTAVQLFLVVAMVAAVSCTKKEEEKVAPAVEAPVTTAPADSAAPAVAPPADAAAPAPVQPAPSH